MQHAQIASLALFQLPLPYQQPHALVVYLGHINQPLAKLYALVVFQGHINHPLVKQHAIIVLLGHGLEPEQAVVQVAVLDIINLYLMLQASPLASTVYQELGLQSQRVRVFSASLANILLLPIHQL